MPEALSFADSRRQKQPHDVSHILLLFKCNFVFQLIVFLMVLLIMWRMQNLGLQMDRYYLLVGTDPAKHNHLYIQGVPSKSTKLVFL
jgi:hypothetical protein